MAKLGNEIVHLTTVHLPFDTRIFHKEAKTLVKAGYDVSLIVQHDKNELVDGVKIIALPKPRSRFTRIFGNLVFLEMLLSKEEMWASTGSVNVA